MASVTRSMDRQHMRACNMQSQDTTQRQRDLTAWITIDKI